MFPSNAKKLSDSGFSDLLKIAVHACVYFLLILFPQLLKEMKDWICNKIMLILIVIGSDIKYPQIKLKCLH